MSALGRAIASTPEKGLGASTSPGAWMAGAPGQVLSAAGIRLMGMRADRIRGDAAGRARLEAQKRLGAGARGAWRWRPGGQRVQPELWTQEELTLRSRRARRPQ